MEVSNFLEHVEGTFMRVPEFQVKRTLRVLVEIEEAGDLESCLGLIKAESPALFSLLVANLVYLKNKNDVCAEDVMIRMFIHLYLSLRAHVDAALTHSLYRKD